MKQNNFLKYMGIGLLIIILYQVILPAIYFNIFRNFAKSSNFWISNLTFIGYYLLITLALIFIYRKSLKNEIKAFLESRKSFSKTALKYWAQGFGLMIISNIIVLSITGAMAGNEAQNREILTAMPLYSITVMCFIGPFIEEMIFRKSFRKAFQNKYTFAITTSLIFASLHVMNSFNPLSLANIIANWKYLLYFLPYSSLAIFFAFSYYETDNIFTSTLAHCFHNTLTVIFILLAL